jgi:hypothetical protein
MTKEEISEILFKLRALRAAGMGTDYRVREWDVENARAAADLIERLKAEIEALHEDAAGENT